MLRIEFTSEDLRKTMISADADPLWEVLLSRFRLEDRHRSVSFRPWVRALTTCRSRAPAVRAGTGVLQVLAPRGRYFPDFLTPPAGRFGLDAGLEALRGTSRHELSRQLGELARHKSLPGWVRPLAYGDVVTLTRLAAVFSTSTTKSRSHRSVSWSERASPPILEVDYTVDRELQLRGRGLRFVPSLAGLVATATMMVMSAGVAHAELSVSHGQSYGYAGAGIDFTGPSSFHVHDLVFADWACDGEAPYAQFFYRLGSSTHRWEYTPTKRYDHSGCDLGDLTTYYNLDFTHSGDTIADLTVVICNSSSGCHEGNIVHNPYVSG